MKKAIYIAMVLISMRFTTISITEHTPARRKKIEKKQAPRQGYLGSGIAAVLFTDSRVLNERSILKSNFTSPGPNDR